MLPCRPFGPLFIMSLTHSNSRKGAKAAPASPGTDQRLVQRKGRALLNHARAGTVRVARVTHAAWRRMGASATSLFAPKPAERLFKAGLLDQLHTPLTWRREC